MNISNTRIWEINRNAAGGRTVRITSKNPIIALIFIVNDGRIVSVNSYIVIA